jgi:lipoprotein-anchoring transpeptidase ErfK/SrfK
MLETQGETVPANRERTRATSAQVALLALAGALTLAGCRSSGTQAEQHAASAPSAPTTTSAAPASPTGPRKGSGTPVHVRMFEGDGRTYGVGMPIIAYFSERITDPSVFDQVVKVTVNGKPADGAWYWEPSMVSDTGLEAHYRLKNYWPAHSAIKVSMPLQGLWAGQGLVFDNDVSLDMKIGAAQLASVDGTPGVDTMRITSDGRPVRTLKVSLGKATTPTYLGTGLVMAKSNPEEMKSDPGETPAYDIEVPWSVRVTNSGEFIHDAYWNGSLGQANLSHGCTNLSPADAEWYYRFAQIGDPVTWTHTGTSRRIPVTDGWGDWNLGWSTWSQGGLLPNTTTSAWASAWASVSASVSASAAQASGSAAQASGSAAQASGSAAQASGSAAQASGSAARASGSAAPASPSAVAGATTPTP